MYDIKIFLIKVTRDGRPRGYVTVISRSICSSRPESTCNPRLTSVRRPLCKSRPSRMHRGPLCPPPAAGRGPTTRLHKRGLDSVVGYSPALLEKEPK
ncbi:hypothetical protein EVAR_49507_1 [Eumeta japonica]|uniref:Uncharacterized protein n=1 Tax=Eumeta variegata TaxID=151549 RepID=A0A4C1VXP4_EUMVA|nr:hypothetical protein EVAR_49507_1 [Eumeta japonica]